MYCPLATVYKERQDYGVGTLVHLPHLTSFELTEGLDLKVLMATDMKMYIFWDVTPCSQV